MCPVSLRQSCSILTIVSTICTRWNFQHSIATLLTSYFLIFHSKDYPDLETDEARRNIWTVDVPLQATHHLRNAINNGQLVPKDVLEKYDMPIVASALKLYLLELPGKSQV